MNQQYLSIDQILRSSPWRALEEHLGDLRERIDDSITRSQRLRQEYREELLRRKPELQEQIRYPPVSAFEAAKNLLAAHTVAAVDGTLAPVPLLGGAKIQVGVVIVSSTGDLVSLVTRILETDLADQTDPVAFFEQLRRARRVSNLLSRAIMLFGERKLLLEHDAEWRLLHGELIPHELRTGAGQPARNLPPTFDLIHGYITTERFLAVSESSTDLDILNAAILLEPGEYLVIRELTDTLELFLEGDPETGQSRANFTNPDRERFRGFIRTVGPKVAVVLVKAGNHPFILECHRDRVDEAVALFLTDSLWSRGLPVDGSALAVRGFPFLLDLADQAAGTLFRAGDFRDFVETRLAELGVELATFDIDPRRTRL
jgi:hypothetical protein